MLLSATTEVKKVKLHNCFYLKFQFLHALSVLVSKTHAPLTHFITESAWDLPLLIKLPIWFCPFFPLSWYIQRIRIDIASYKLYFGPGPALGSTSKLVR